MHPHAESLESQRAERKAQTYARRTTVNPAGRVLRPLFLKAREAGQGTIEYIGIAVAAGLIIAGLVAVPFGPRMASGINDIICGIFSESPFGGTPCASQEPIAPEDYMTECPMIASDQRRGSEVDIAFFTIGSGVRMKVVKMSDGTAEVSLVGDVTAGANFEAAKVDINEWLKVNAGVGVDVTASHGDTWRFDNWADADAFAQANKNRVESGWNYVPVVGPIVNKANAPENPRITTYGLDLSGWGSADAGVNVNKKKKQPDENGQVPPSEDGEWKSSDYDPKGESSANGKGNAASNFDLMNLLPKGSVKVDRTNSGALKHDRGDNLDDAADDTYTYSFDVMTSGNVDGKGLGFDAGANGGVKTAMSVKTDNNGNVIGLQIAQSHQHGGGFGGAKDDNTSTVYTADFDLSDPATRETIMNFMQNPGGLPDFQQLTSGDIKPQTPEQQAMLDLLRSPNVKINEMTMNNINESDGFSLGAKLMGVGLGYNSSDTSTESTLSDAYTYVPKTTGGYERVKNTKCG